MYEQIGNLLYASNTVVNRLSKKGMNPSLKHRIINLTSFTALYISGSSSQIMSFGYRKLFIISYHIVFVNSTKVSLNSSFCL